MEIDIPGAGTKAAYEFKIDLIVWKYGSINNNSFITSGLK